MDTELYQFLSISVFQRLKYTFLVLAPYIRILHFKYYTFVILSSDTSSVFNSLYVSILPNQSIGKINTFIKTGTIITDHFLSHHVLQTLVSAPK